MSSNANTSELHPLHTDPTDQRSLPRRSGNAVPAPPPLINSRNDARTPRDATLLGARQSDNTPDEAVGEFRSAAWDCPSFDAKEEHAAWDVRAATFPMVRLLLAEAAADVVECASAAPGRWSPSLSGTRGKPNSADVLLDLVLHDAETSLTGTCMP